MITKELLNQYRAKQPFRVSTGEKYIINGKEYKAKWYSYEKYSPKWKLREILSNEIVIEFDIDNPNIAYEGINFTGINLYNDKISFEVWNHGGRSPHLHIRNLPITHLSKDKLKLFKELFIKKYVPSEYLPYVDFTLTRVHLIAIEGVEHWKNGNIKVLLSKFNPDTT